MKPSLKSPQTVNVKPMQKVIRIMFVPNCSEFRLKGFKLSYMITTAVASGPTLSILEEPKKEYKKPGKIAV